jgi:hypothetical protein
MQNIIYSHTSYSDILKIQTDYISKYDNKILFINHNDILTDELYNHYDKVIFYDDSLQYAQRLNYCIDQIEDEYFTLIHDIDILINMDISVIDNLYKYMIEKDIDRIDLKYSDKLNCEVTDITSNSIDEWKIVESVGRGLFLLKQVNVNEYIYNVNPSIWKKTAILNLLGKFPYKTYRDIEQLDVQYYCLNNFTVYKLYSDKVLECGYFQCVSPFVYLHITHGGRMLYLDNNDKTEYNQSYIDLSDEYKSIVSKYDLQKSEKWVR